MRKKMTGLLSILFILYLIGLSIYPQDAFSQAEKSFLWKAQSKTSTVYVLGSIHYLKKENYPLSKKIENAFDESGVLVVEANITDKSKMNSQN